jgi:hypothetical protein
LLAQRAPHLQQAAALTQPQNCHINRAHHF